MLVDRPNYDSYPRLAVLSTSKGLTRTSSAPKIRSPLSNVMSATDSIDVPKMSHSPSSHSQFPLIDYACNNRPREALRPIDGNSPPIRCHQDSEDKMIREKSPKSPTSPSKWKWSFSRKRSPPTESSVEHTFLSPLASNPPEHCVSRPSNPDPYSRRLDVYRHDSGSSSFPSAPSSAYLHSRKLDVYDESKPEMSYDSAVLSWHRSRSDPAQGKKSTIASKSARKLAFGRSQSQHSVSNTFSHKNSFDQDGLRRGDIATKKIQLKSPAPQLPVFVHIKGTKFNIDHANWALSGDWPDPVPRPTTIAPRKTKTNRSSLARSRSIMSQLRPSPMTMTRSLSMPTASVSPYARPHAPSIDIHGTSGSTTTTTMRQSRDDQWTTANAHKYLGAQEPSIRPNTSRVIVRTKSMGKASYQIYY